MSTTWEAINQQLDLFFDDAVGDEENNADRLFTEQLRIESWNWAQRVFVAHTPLAKSMRLAIEEGKREALLPLDFYATENIKDTTDEQWWRPMRRRPGDAIYNTEDLPEFWAWGNRLFLEQEVAYTQSHLTLFYWAYYPDVVYTMDGVEVEVREGNILIPKWAEVAVMHLTAAMVFQPSSIAAADINQWKIRIDSGSPLMNPRALQAREHLWWYESILSKFAPAVVTQQ